jgi:hypothetical protein
MTVIDQPHINASSDFILCESCTSTPFSLSTVSRRCPAGLNTGALTICRSQANFTHLDANRMFQCGTTESLSGWMCGSKRWKFVGNSERQYTSMPHQPPGSRGPIRTECRPDVCGVLTLALLLVFLASSNFICWHVTVKQPTCVY